MDIRITFQDALLHMAEKFEVRVEEINAVFENRRPRDLDGKPKHSIRLAPDSRVTLSDHFNSFSDLYPIYILQFFEQCYHVSKVSSIIRDGDGVREKYLILLKKIKKPAPTSSKNSKPLQVKKLHSIH